MGGHEDISERGDGMSLVVLVSGGIDSALMSTLAHEEGLKQFPLFIDYGQICRDKELEACMSFHERCGLPMPTVMDIHSFGKIIPSGLTDTSLDVNEDAFLPGRNLLFLLMGSAYAYKNKADTVAIGLLDEDSHIFPDQTRDFLEHAEKTIGIALGKKISLIAPLMEFTKENVIRIAHEKGITDTYSCHSGADEPCGMCISCQEVIGGNNGW
jgi:7-cyano-7-deazaguanine synthase